METSCLGCPNMKTPCFSENLVFFWKQRVFPIWLIWRFWWCMLFISIWSDIPPCPVQGPCSPHHPGKSCSNINPISIRILSESPWNLFRSGPSNGCSPGILLYLGWRRGHTGCTKWFLHTKKQNNYINHMMEKDNGFPSCFFLSIILPFSSLVTMGDF